VDIRCESGTKFAVASEDAAGELEILCRNKLCKVFGNEIVIHVFNLGKIDEDGTIRPTKTKRFKRPK